MRLIPRPAIARWQLFLATAAWIATVPNFPTLRQFSGSSSSGQGPAMVVFTFGGWAFVLTVILALLVVLGIFFWGRAARYLSAAMLVAAAALGYFSIFLGVRFDKGMVPNLLQTNPAEAQELLNPRLVAWVLAAGVVPAALVLAARLRPAGMRATAASMAALVLVPALLTGGIVYARYSAYASAARNRDITFDTVAPANLLAAGIVHFASLHASRTVRAERGTDAHQAYAIPKPRLLFFVLGETARAANHGLNGYLRDTTPRMKAARGHYFPDTESCGTATAVSVPCLFSGFSRHEFSLLRGLSNETLVDVVLRAGARVVWRDNDSGCKGVCDKSDFIDLTGSDDPRFCSEPGNCFDEILLDGLEGKVRAESRDTLVVLHLKGSHGPAYYKRYPDDFDRFAPTCRSTDLSSCTPEELRNAYDNTILYTDHVVGESIAMLQRLSDRYATALLYVSDHGESLGEGGLYLHGMPYAMAPREQTHVPMYAWVSPQFMQLERWNAECMALQTRLPRSHDNVYATVLGFMEVESVEYKPALDLFEPCDPPAAKTAKPAVPR